MLMNPITNLEASKTAKKIWRIRRHSKNIKYLISHFDKTPTFQRDASLRCNDVFQIKFWKHLFDLNDGSKLRIGYFCVFKSLVAVKVLKPHPFCGLLLS